MYKPHAGLAKRSPKPSVTGADGRRGPSWRMRKGAVGAVLASVALCGATAAPAVASGHHRGQRHDAAAARHQHRAKAGRSRRGKAALKETYVRESASLRLARKRGGSAIVEQGAGHGTFSATVQLTVAIKTTHVTGGFVAHLSGGSIYGRAGATPHFSKNGWVSFKGTLRITRGTGRYAGASGTAGFYGAVNRYNFKMNVQVVGHLRL